MLFLQGRRDALADPGLLHEALKPLGDRATLEAFEDADHAFHVRKSSGWTDDMVLRAIAARAAEWMGRVVGGPTA